MPAPFLIGGLLASLLSSPRAYAEIKQRMVDGVKVTEHLDENDSPCGDARSTLAGCHQLRPDGHHVWYSAISPQYLIDHELAHVKGMLHTPWQQRRDGPFGNNMLCSLVYQPGANYEINDEICITNRGETRRKVKGLLDEK